MKTLKSIKLQSGLKFKMPIYKTDIRKDGKQQYRVRINYTTNDGPHYFANHLCHHKHNYEKYSALFLNLLPV